MFKKLLKNNVGYDIWRFEDIFSNEELNYIQDCSKEFTYSLIQGKRTDRNDRIWMNNHLKFKNLCNFFDSYQSKKYFSDITGELYINCRTRIELCLDKKGSYLDEHVDDPAKKFTMQVYLSNCKISTNFNLTQTEAKENSGWFFNNTGTEIHSLSTLQDDRISIIINYVDNNWRDKTVLV